MITLTDLAANRLQAMLRQKGLPDHGLRVFVQGGGCAGYQYGMAFEPTSREGDIVLEIKGVRIFVDPFSTPYLEGACIEYEDRPVGGGFRLDNPNVVATCACGNSFRIEGEHQVAGR
jgi:iron-sulfur cluster assembly protein